MADTGSGNHPCFGLPLAEAPRPRRAHTYSRLTTAIAVLALATSSYALLRLDATRDRLDRTNDVARAADADRAALRAELKSQTNRERPAARELDRRLDVAGRRAEAGRRSCCSRSKSCAAVPKVRNAPGRAPRPCS